MGSSAPSTTPSKKKASETHYKSKAELILERSPSAMKALREKQRFNATSPKGESSARHSGATPSKSPSAAKSAPKDESSDDEDAAFERLRAQGSKELENPKTSVSKARVVDASESSDDDDAPVAKSFKDVKKEAIEQQHGELEDSRAVSAKEKEKRRQRTQHQQEQSKKTSQKKKSKQKRANAMDVDEETELLDAAVLQRAMSQNQTEQMMEEDQEDDSKLNYRKMRQLEREMEQKEKIDSKRVTVIALSDSTGVPQMQSRKAASQSAESFLKEHFWGGRLERMPADHYLSERIRGPALQFIVPNAASFETNDSQKSMKTQRRIQHKRRRL